MEASERQEFAQFAQTLTRWFSTQGYQPLIETLANLRFKNQGAHPKIETLWRAALMRYLSQEQLALARREPELWSTLIQGLKALSEYALAKDVAEILEKAGLGHAHQSSQAWLIEQILSFLPQSRQWFEGLWLERLREDWQGAMQQIALSHRFDDLWDVALFLSDNGWFCPSSKGAFEGWLKYSGQSGKSLDHALWWSLLEEAAPDPKALLRLDHALDCVFGQEPVLSLPLLCHSHESCGLCPLKRGCSFFLKLFSTQGKKSLEVKLRLGEATEIETKDLLVYLLGERWQDTKRQRAMVSMPFDVELGLFDDLRTEEDKQVLYALLGYQELARRKAGQKTMEPGQIFRDSRDIFEHFHPQLAKEKQESFFTLILDNQHRIIKLKMVTKGILDRSLVHPREVFAPALSLRANAIVLIHNHPGGNPKPSQQDIKVTQRLCEVSRLVGIKVLDHIIIAQDDYFSFTDKGMMPAVGD